MPDRERFENFARDMLGFLSPDPRMEKSRMLGRINISIALPHVQPAPVLRYVGSTSEALKSLPVGDEARSRRDRLAPQHPEECGERHVTDFIEFKDPDGPSSFVLRLEVEKSRCTTPVT
jgi:hypothetical protein